MASTLLLEEDSPFATVEVYGEADWDENKFESEPAQTGRLILMKKGSTKCAWRIQVVHKEETAIARVYKNTLTDRHGPYQDRKAGLFEGREIEWSNPREGIRRNLDPWNTSK